MARLSKAQREGLGGFAPPLQRGPGGRFLGPPDGDDQLDPDDRADHRDQLDQLDLDGDLHLDLLDDDERRRYDEIAERIGEVEADPVYRRLVTIQRQEAERGARRQARVAEIRAQLATENRIGEVSRLKGELSQAMSDHGFDSNEESRQFPYERDRAHQAALPLVVERERLRAERDDHERVAHERANPPPPPPSPTPLEEAEAELRDLLDRQREARALAVDPATEAIELPALRAELVDLAEQIGWQELLVQREREIAAQTPTGG